MLILFFNIGSFGTKDTVFWVRKECAVTRYTFGHELGHLFGAGHCEGQDNVETLEKLKYGYPFGHGYRFDDEDELDIDALDL